MEENAIGVRSDYYNELQGLPDVDSEARLPQIEDFVFMKPISKGAFGKVFLGHKKTIPSKLYAIKVMKKEELVNKNLKKQATAERDAMAVSRSPFIVHLYYSLESKQNIFLVMEYLIGGDVKSLLAICGYFDEEMAVMYTAEVTLALEYLHQHGIVHRDLKPDNMLITDQGHIKLTDFGLSKISMDIARTECLNRSPHDQFRTPGQILSLRLPFHMPSTRKLARSVLQSPCTPTVNRSRKKFQTPLRERSLNLSVSRFSFSSVLSRKLSSSTIARLTPPVQSLTPTLQDSLNWESSLSDVTFSHRRRSSGLSNCSKSNNNSCSSVINNSCVFSEDILPGDARNMNAEKENRPELAEDCCLNCESHCKVPLRKESFSDDTPQLHRTNESVWNSYAAKNLRSMREGSYSEESDDEHMWILNDLSDSEQSYKSRKEFSPLTSTNMSRHQVSNTYIRSSQCSYHSEDNTGTDCSPGEQRHFSHINDSGPSQPGSSDLSHLRTIQEEKKNLVSSDSDESEVVSCDIDLPFTPNLMTKCQRRRSQSRVLPHDSPLIPCTGLSPQVRNICLSSNDSPFTYGKSTTKTASSDFQPRWHSAPIEIFNLNSAELNSTRAFGTTKRTLKSKRTSLSTRTGLTQGIENISITPRHDRTFRAKKRSFDLVDDHLVQLSDASQNCCRTECEFKLYGDEHRHKKTDNRETPLKMASLNDRKSLSGTSDEWVRIEFSDERLRCKEDNNTSSEDLSLNDQSQTPLRTRMGSVDRLYSVEHDTSLGSLASLSVISGTQKKDVQFNSDHISNEGTSYHCSSGTCQTKGYHTPYRTPGKTPLRTPKSVRRGQQQLDEHRILGTPDYLAPEILLHKPHDAAVDWWALGVCLFEFLTGWPPFNDETPELVFQNILSKDIPWPENDEALGDRARQAIDVLLTMDPQERPNAHVVKGLRLFVETDWDTLLEMEAPFIPQPDDETDTTYFAARMNLQQLVVSEIDL